ncbi:MAG: hypothetical protein GXP41_00695 [Chloroflexi bacterium]|nr:hypothetical protein [Chloroflexota bacterium]
MPESQELAIQEGIWIDNRWVRKAGLGTQLRVLVLPKEIRILPISDEADASQTTPRGWDVFRSLGRDAQPGKLPNAAVDHDHYLYSKKQ